MQLMQSISIIRCFARFGWLLAKDSLLSEDAWLQRSRIYDDYEINGHKRPH